jgi:hypothetical protein
LAGDTTVTVETVTPSSDLPDSANLKGLIYDFGPDGTMFSTPATLTLPSVGDPGTGNTAVVAWLDETSNTWQNLATTVNADGSLSAEISHFTSFVVRLNGMVSSDCSFTSCGGDVVGTWQVTGLCASAEMALGDACPDAMASLDLTLTGTATFSADGTSASNFTSGGSLSYTLPAACLGGATSCDALSKPADADTGATVCSGDASVSCTCVETQLDKTEMKTGTWTKSGNTLSTTDDADASMSTIDFCVNGSEGRFSQVEGLATLLWIATKQ